MTSTVIETKVQRFLNEHPGLKDQMDREALEIVEEPEEVPWAEVSDEAGVPITHLLKDLNLLEKPGHNVQWLHGTPFDKQAITAGATHITKVVTSLVAGVGGVAALGTYFAAWRNSSGPLDWVLVSCATLLLCVTAIALAWLVKTDLEARAVATAAQYHARAEATTAWLATVRPGQHVKVASLNRGGSS